MTNKNKIWLVLVTFVTALLCFTASAFGFMQYKAISSEEQPEEVATFDMRYGAQIRTVEPCGIRFLTDVSADFYNSFTEPVFGTLIIPNALLGKNGELNFDTQSVVNLQADNWVGNEDAFSGDIYTYTATIVGDKDGDDYTGLPSTFWNTKLTAVSYVYEKAAGSSTAVFTASQQTRSLAQVAARALQLGREEENNEFFKNICDTVLTNASASLSFEEGTSFKAAQESSFTLTLNGSLGLGAIWTSSDESVATVDANGTVTTITAGSTTITATVGNNSVSLALTVVGVSQDVVVDFTSQATVDAYFTGDDVLGNATYLESYAGENGVAKFAFGDNGSVWHNFSFIPMLSMKNYEDYSYIVVRARTAKAEVSEANYVAAGLNLVNVAEDTVKPIGYEGWTWDDTWIDYRFDIAPFLKYWKDASVPYTTSAKVWFKTANGDNETYIYVSKVTVVKGAANLDVSLSTAGNLVVGNAVTLTANNPSATFALADPDGSAVTLTAGAFTPTKAGVYTATISVSGYNGTKTQAIRIKPADEVLSFSDEGDLDAIKTSNATLSRVESVAGVDGGVLRVAHRNTNAVKLKINLAETTPAYASYDYLVVRARFTNGTGLGSIGDINMCGRNADYYDTWVHHNAWKNYVYSIAGLTTAQINNLELQLTTTDNATTAGEFYIDEIYLMKSAAKADLNINTAGSLNVGQTLSVSVVNPSNATIKSFTLTDPSGNAVDTPASFTAEGGIYTATICLVDGWYSDSMRNALYYGGRETNLVFKFRVAGETGLRFVVASDMHISTAATGETNAARFANMFTQIGAWAGSDAYNKIDALALVGDIADSGSSADLNRAKSVIDDNIGVADNIWENTQLVATIGNHEYWGNKDNPALAISNFEDVFGSCMNHVVIGGYHFITVRTSGTRAGDPGWDYTAEEVAYVTNELAVAYADTGADKPIFVMQHVGNLDTAVGTCKYSKGSGVDTLNSLYANYPNIVCFAGHSHFPSNDECAIHQKDYTSVATGTMYNAMRSYSWGEPIDMANKGNIATALVVDVDSADGITIRCWDVLKGEFVGETWSINSYNKEDFVYTEDRFSSEDLFFANDAVVTADTVNAYNATISFPVVPQNSLSARVYKVVVKDTSNNVIDSRYLSIDYYNEPTDDVSVLVAGLDPNTTYNVYVYAINSLYCVDISYAGYDSTYPYALVSTPITGSFTTAAYPEVLPDQVLPLEHRSDINKISSSDITFSWMISANGVNDGVAKGTYNGGKTSYSATIDLTEVCPNYDDYDWIVIRANFATTGANTSAMTLNGGNPVYYAGWVYDNAWRNYIFNISGISASQAENLTLGFTTKNSSTAEGVFYIDEIYLLKGASDNDMSVELVDNGDGTFGLSVANPSNAPIASISVTDPSSSAVANYSSFVPVKGTYTVNVSIATALGGDMRNCVYYGGGTSGTTTITLTCEYTGHLSILDFDSQAQFNTYTYKGITGNSVNGETQEWMSSYEGATGVVKVAKDGNWAYFAFKPSQAMSYYDNARYVVMRMYFVGDVSGLNISFGGVNATYTKLVSGKWINVYFDGEQFKSVWADSISNFYEWKHRITFNKPVEVYIDDIYAIEYPRPLQDFDVADSDYIQTDSMTATFLDSYQGAEGVLRMTSSGWAAFSFRPRPIIYDSSSNVDSVASMSEFADAKYVVLRMYVASDTPDLVISGTFGTTTTPVQVGQWVDYYFDGAKFIQVMSTNGKYGESIWNRYFSFSKACTVYIDQVYIIE